MEGRGSSRGTAAYQPQRRAGAGRLGHEVATAAAVCAAAGAEVVRDSARVEGGGFGGAGPLCEVDREDKRGAEEAGDPPFLQPCRQGGEATERGA